MHKQDRPGAGWCLQGDRVSRSLESFFLYQWTGIDSFFLQLLDPTQFMATITKTYAQLAREIEALQASASKLLALEVQSAIASINQSIALYGLTVEDLRFEGVRSSSSTAASALKSPDAKFSDGKGQFWSGRGPRPIWLRNALLQGRTLESFAVSGTGASAKTSRPTGTAAKTAAPKPANKLPALFQHAETGKTWSGRGPQPAWLKQGLKKRGATLDDFRVAKADAAPTGPQSPAASPSVPAKAPVAVKKAAAVTTSLAVPAPARKSTSNRASSKPPSAPNESSPSPAPAASSSVPAGSPKTVKTWDF